MVLAPVEGMLGPERVREVVRPQAAVVVAVMPGTVERYLAGQHSPEAKLEKLYTLEENVIGVANKRELVGFVVAILGSPRTEAYFVDSAEAPAPRLQILADISKRNRRAGFQDLEKRQIADRIDQIALQIERKGAMLDSLIRSLPDPVHAVGRLLGLVTGGGLPDGALTELVRERARALMKRPAFKDAVKATDPVRLEALGQLIAQAGLDLQGNKPADAA